MRQTFFHYPIISYYTMATLLYNNRPSLRPSRALSTMLADMLRDPDPPAPPTPAFTPAADILETATGFELHLALPGVKKEAVNIEFLDGQLVVSGTRPNPARPPKKPPLRYGSSPTPTKTRPPW